jgi:hypothetical protein
VAFPERGLGTALSSILSQGQVDPTRDARLHALIPPVAPAAPPPAPAPFRDLVTLSLDILEALTPLDFCAFIYRRTGEGLRVHGRRRARAHRFDGFELLDAATAQLDAGEDAAEVVLGDTYCLAVASTGRRSQGLIFMGRTGAGLQDDETRWAVPVSWLLGSVLQASVDLP